ncbi:MAG: hypothetical protein LCI00_13235 [Chloroflexi bacterium]|jgi:hypothetical protein|nr:hypothetical protein [Chloroflexota bacterium]
MNDELSLAQVQRSMLLRSIYLMVAPIMLLFVVLACGTIVTDLASYICPTAVPQATATTLAGTPMPTLPPMPTPYTITPPQDFYVGDAVFVGQSGAPLRLRFRLQNVQTQPAGSRNLVTWRLEIRNLGSATYETIPVALMVIIRINTASGEQSGTWRTSETAMAAAGFTSENYDPLTPGSIRVYRLAAYIPAGSVRQFAFLLDGEGGNRITWVNAANPYCSGDVAD